MNRISLLGILHDENSSFMRGPAEAPGPIRRELRSDAYSIRSETGIDLGVAGRLVDHGDIQFDAATDPWDAIEATVGRALESGDPRWAPDLRLEIRTPIYLSVDMDGLSPATVAAKLLEEIAGVMFRNSRERTS